MMGRSPRTTAERAHLPAGGGSRKRATLALTSLLVFAALLTAVPAFAAEPTIESSPAIGLSPTCESLRAVLVPREVPTTYHFEYLTEAQFQSEGGFLSPHTESTPDDSIASEPGDFHRVSAKVCGLTPRTSYRFRLLAANSESPPGGTPGPTATFTPLPDGPSHEFTATFGAATSTSPNPYPLSGPTDVAVDQSSHDIYVTDPGSYRIEKFSPSGEFLLMFGNAVNKTAVETPSSTEAQKDVCTKSEICQSGSPSSTPGGFELPAYLTVDNSGGPSAGDVYVADNGDRLVQKFDSSGHLISGWGELGQKDGSDMTDSGGNHPPFGTIFGLAIGSAGKLYVLDDHSAVYEYTQNGTPIVRTFFGGAVGPIDPGFFKVDPTGNFYTVSANVGPEFPDQITEVFKAHDLESNEEADKSAGAITSTGPTTGFALEFPEEGLYQGAAAAAPAEARIYHYPELCASENHVASPCKPVDSFGEGHLFEPAGMDIGAALHTVYVANTGANDVAAFLDIRPVPPTTEPATEIGETSATLTGDVEPGEHGGKITQCHFEIGIDKSYGRSLPCSPDPASNPPGSYFPAHTAVAAVVSGLTASANLPIGTQYHYRLVVENEDGATGVSRDRAFNLTAAPTIQGLSSSHVTATSARLAASLNPNGLPTTYHFEYGTTTAYGSAVPLPDGEIGPSQAAQQIEIPITGLQGVTYHFRLIAHNALGTVTSEDQTFTFFPPACPNAAVRQQTGSAYLPDCRAYELVSPGNANATLLYPGGPNTGQATNPSRFSFTGDFSALPGADTINTGGDLYVSTRTDEGWVSRYIGLPGSQAACMGGPPLLPTSHVAVSSPPWLTNSVLADPSMNRFMIWLDGSATNCVPGPSPFSDSNWAQVPPSNAPFIFGADGTDEQRLPTEFPGGAGAIEALKCPYYTYSTITPPCKSDVNASGDLSHLVFSSNTTSFAAGGLEKAPGSAYDNDVANNTISLISLDSSGHPIPQDPGFAHQPAHCYFGPCPPLAERRKSPSRNEEPETTGGEEEYIRFPAVSTDGSHILMSTATAGTPNCDRGQQQAEACPRYLDFPIHLYMRVADAITYEPSRGEDGVNHAVNFVGMTPDGSKVYFTSTAQLVAADKDTSADLYMWSEESNSLTLLSKGSNAGEPGEPGNSDSCEAGIIDIPAPRGTIIRRGPWTAKCGARALSGYAYSWLTGGAGGNGISDSGIAENGDIYFYSPEQLDGNRGVPGRENLYVYRGGSAHFVATLDPHTTCTVTGVSGSNRICTEEPLVRFNVTPDDSRAAFVTASRLTPYENAGHLEMYSYTPATGAIVCDSCRPDGQPTTSDVSASQDGRFLTDDGRVFFSTSEPLVPQDTNHGPDVYEFVDGRPQLITPGTGTGTAAQGLAANFAASAELSGLVGVSSNGADVYFSTFDTLISEDHNGNFLKFYDARTNGGFPQPPPAQPCAAAEECHGPGTEAPQLPSQGTAATLAGGNATPEHHAKHHKKRKKAAKEAAAKKSAAKHHHARASANRGGKK